VGRHGHAAEARPRGNARSRQHAAAHTRTRLKVFIFSEHAIYCDGLERLLVADSGVRVVGSTAEWSIAAHAARTCRPDIILLDTHTPFMARGSLVAELLATCRSARIIMLSPEIDERVVGEALRLGIRGILSKNVNGDVLAKSIRAVAAGQHWIDREILIRVVQALNGNGASHRTGSDHQPFGLTGRELEIVSIVLRGGPNKEIARACGISEKTVKRHLTNIFDKLGLSNRLELAVFALEHRLVTRHAGNSGQNTEAV
jgi:two-component system nitrate/nitrite response regulator NarL